MEHTITVVDVIIPDLCPMLGIPLAMSVGAPSNNSPSLDRIDSSKGYIPGNVWVISHKANSMKRDATREELLTFADGDAKVEIVVNDEHRSFEVRRIFVR